MATEVFHQFNTFPHVLGYNPISSFENNMEAHILRFAIEKTPTMWCTILEDNNIHVPLYIIVDESNKPFCEDCRFVGWADDHCGSRKSYQLIIPPKTLWDKEPELVNINSTNHILHGLFHTNGLGHLLQINGLRGGSVLLAGRSIMDLFDRFCSTLRTRHISVKDFATKRSMELRVLLHVAYNHTWFGRWGYKYVGVPNFGVKEQLGSLTLESIKQRYKDEVVLGILDFYKLQTEFKILTFQDLLTNMLSIRPYFESSKFRQLKERPVEVDDNIKDEAVAILEKLITFKQNGIKNVSRAALRVESIHDVGNRGFLDNILKQLKNVVLGDYIIRKSLNSTGKIQFTLYDVVEPAEPLEAPAPTPGLDVLDDLAYLYRTVIVQHEDTPKIMEACYYVKNWDFQSTVEEAARGGPLNAERVKTCECGEFGKRVFFCNRCHRFEHASCCLYGKQIIFCRLCKRYEHEISCKIDLND